VKAIKVLLDIREIEVGHCGGLWGKQGKKESAIHCRNRHSSSMGNPPKEPPAWVDCHWCWRDCRFYQAAS
jgi:hypothetical protein